MKANIKTSIKNPTIYKFQDIHITDHCQLNCKHCYLHPKNKTHMPLDMVLNLIKDFKSINHPVLNTNVILSGGEPLLYPYFKSILQYLRLKHIPLMMSSNGLLIPENIHLFKKEDGIQISIDGDQETHDFIRGEGTHQQAENALYLLDKHNIRHSVTMAVSVENAHAINAVIQLCQNTHTTSLNLTPFQAHPSTSLTPLTYQKWLEILKKVRTHTNNPHIPRTCVEGGCIAGILGYSVLPDGTYWDCSRNQKIIGKYPDRIKDKMAWNLINIEGTHNPLNTCCKQMEQI